MAVHRAEALRIAGTDYRRAASVWIGEQAGARHDAATWRWIALASLVLLGAVATTAISDGRPQELNSERPASALAGAVWYIQPASQIGSSSAGDDPRGR